ncbi:acyl-CoA thioesterase [Nocardia asteroides]|uniref:acyl-CoA thioesterase n=1 Tax=Nocardia asteroides TaxID=1824 RepID=UPI001E482536|nr:thioesterase family protein [Nocardia asteroides]UGT62620.1 thioesterase family protein [Nocardia asteroides]
MEPRHPFDAATALDPVAEGEFRGHTAPEYSNMVGPFGGITAATLLRAVLDDPRRLGEPVSLTVNFAGPIADGPFTVRTHPARTNRSTQHWTLELVQDDAVTTTATAVTALRRPTWTDSEIAPPQVPPFAEAAPFLPPEFPVWMGKYEQHFVEGAGLLAAEAGPRPDSVTTVWVRDTPPRPLDRPALTALCDVFIPRAMVRTGRLVPAGTVSLTVYFHADAGVLAAVADRPVLGTARAQHFGAGFFDQSATVWSPDGVVLATSHQLVYFKD